MISQSASFCEASCGPSVDWRGYSFLTYEVLINPRPAIANLSSRSFHGFLASRLSGWISGRAFGRRAKSGKIFSAIMSAILALKLLPRVDFQETPRKNWKGVGLYQPLNPNSRQTNFRVIDYSEETTLLSTPVVIESGPISTMNLDRSSKRATKKSGSPFQFHQCLL